MVTATHTFWKRLQKWTYRASISLWLPLLLLILFFALTVVAFVYQKQTAAQNEAERTQADLQGASNQLDARLLEQRLALTALSALPVNTPAQQNTFDSEAQKIITRYPELYAIHILDMQANKIAGFASPKMVNGLLYAHGDSLESGFMHADTYKKIRQSAVAAYSPVILYGLSFDTVSPRAFAYDQSASVQLLIPIEKSKETNRENTPNKASAGDNSNVQYVLLAEYAVDGLYKYALHNELMGRYATALTDAKGLAYTGSIIVQNPEQNWWQQLVYAATKPSIPTQRLSIAGLDNQLSLQVQHFNQDQSGIENLIWLAITALGILMAWIMASSWRHNRWRARTQRQLQNETVFRRAIEKSMLTGLRVIDMEKRITHVNAAFCQMTGYSEEELVGTTPPYPYWPQTDHKKLKKQIDQHFDDIPIGGYPIQLQRKTGEVFDGFMYISPLIDDDETGDATGNVAQRGWVTSITDVTESNRIKGELSQAHERFAKVLNSMDSSVSVASVETGDLLFSNRIYQQWFGPDQYGMAHNQLINLMPQLTEENYRASQYDDGGVHVETAEVFGTEWGRWLNLQTRPLRWTDGSAAIMLLATDVTIRKNAQEINAINMAKLQANTHLVTMGEMASSVAHELNQPLTAISNYSSGILKRLETGVLNDGMLESALQKIGKQAERAGLIIRRIREFIKRSEPKRTAIEVQALLNDTKEMVEVDMLRRRCKLTVQADSGLPTLLIDPLLIQQVLVNLTKNAAEAIDNASQNLNGTTNETTDKATDNKRPAKRKITMRAYSSSLQSRPAIAFSVQDTGPGLDPAIQNKLFDAFYSTKSEGMGIGLNLCRSIVEAHMGKIEAENIYNENQETVGCVFRFTLPLAGNTTDAHVAEAMSIPPQPFDDI